MHWKRALRFISAVAMISLGAAACAFNEKAALLKTLRSDFADVPHDCVPLGWVPVRVGNTYYPGYSAEMQDVNSWVPALWLGSVHAQDVTKSDIRVTYSILNALVRNGLLESRQTPRGRHYNLTLRGMGYYSDRNEFGNNPDHLAYMCFSQIVPRRIVWNQAPSGGAKNAHALKASFEWRRSEAAPWATGFFRTHSVILSPTRTPATATFVLRDKEWHVQSLSQTAPQIVQPSAWK